LFNAGDCTQAVARFVRHPPTQGGGDGVSHPATSRIGLVTGEEEFMAPPHVTAVVLSAVALVQISIAVVEVFLWNAPSVHRRLHYTKEEARKVAPIVANAGLYNAFLAAWLIWALLSGGEKPELAVFFLSCVIVAGVFGAVTLKPTTLLIQTVPAILALAATLTAKVP